MNNGLVENFGDYPRYVNMVAGASLEESDMFNSQQVCELRMPNAEASQVVLKGVGTDVGDVVGSVVGSQDSQFSNFT